MEEKDFYAEVCRPQFKAILDKQDTADSKVAEAIVVIAEIKVATVNVQRSIDNMYHKIFEGNGDMSIISKMAINAKRLDDLESKKEEMDETLKNLVIQTKDVQDLKESKKGWGSVLTQIGVAFIIVVGTLYITDKWVLNKGTVIGSEKTTTSLSNTNTEKK